MAEAPAWSTSVEALQAPLRASLQAVKSEGLEGKWGEWRYVVVALQTLGQRRSAKGAGAVR